MRLIISGHQAARFFINRLIRFFLAAAFLFSFLHMFPNLDNDRLPFDTNQQFYTIAITLLSHCESHRKGHTSYDLIDF